MSEPFPYDRLDRAPVGAVYVHAPYCARRCVYCDFAVDVEARPDTARWLDAVTQEWHHWLGRGLRTAPLLDSFYVGGGTPSLLAPDVMTHLGAVVGEERLKAPDLEWTAEANPESFTTEVAEAWAGAGVNRVSFGVQSFDSEVLRWMGRLHTPEESAAAVSRARNAGISNISVDLIFGLPEEAPRSWADDLEQALELDVPHVSLYGLTVEPETALGRRVQEGRTAPPLESRYAMEYLEAVDALTTAGYRAYEVSNFARPGYEARHNSTYWRHEPYLGLGNGSHSYASGVRWWNYRSLDDYFSNVSDLGPVEGFEIPDPESRVLEEIWLGLRQDTGLDLNPLHTDARKLIEGWVGEGLAEVIGDAARLTPQGWLLLDELAIRLAETA